MKLKNDLKECITKSLSENVVHLIDIVPSFSWISVDKFKNVIDISINFYESRYNVYNIDITKEITADDIDLIVNDVIKKSEHHLKNLIKNLNHTIEEINI